MSNHNIFLKYDGEKTTWSENENGNYNLLEETTITSVVGGGDTITFKGLSGIERIMKNDDGLNGTKPMIKSKKGEDSDTVVATIVENTVKGEIDKYDIKFKPENGGKPVIVDPRIEGNGKK